MCDSWAQQSSASLSHLFFNSSYHRKTKKSYFFAIQSKRPGTGFCIRHCSFFLHLHPFSLSTWDSPAWHLTANTCNDCLRHYLATKVCLAHGSGTWKCPEINACPSPNPVPLPNNWICINTHVLSPLVRWSGWVYIHVLFWFPDFPSKIRLYLSTVVRCLKGRWLSALSYFSTPLPLFPRIISPINYLYSKIYLRFQGPRQHS